jgi:polyisoprenoid-binding protein YceI
MKRKIAVVCFLAVCTAAPAFCAELNIENAAATFLVKTSVPAISVKGKSTAIHVRASVRRETETLRIEQIEASVPVMSLMTGMSVRDEHMRRHIFTTPDGRMPDLRFDAAGATCAPVSGKKGGFLCPLTGSLKIRGAAHPSPFR